jgi:hypothetical protein
MKPSYLLLALLLGLSGCLLDLYGGNPRFQVTNASHRWKLESVGLGDTSKPGWTEQFDPPVVFGGLTQVLDLPVAGDLKIFLRLRDTLGIDSVAHLRLSVEAGDFRKLEIAEDSLRRLILH